MSGLIQLHRGSSDQFWAMQHGFTAAPLDSTTYYDGTTVMTTAAAINRMYFDRAGIINKVTVGFIVATVLGSSETSSVYLRKNNTTDYTITSGAKQDALSQYYSNLTLNMPIAAGDYLEVKWVTPAWVTNPTNVYMNTQFLLE